MYIDVLTYNMSWATQINKKLGSEKDFVEACQTEYTSGGYKCTKDAINNIGKLNKLSLIGLQEVNSDLENKITKIQPTLTKYLRGKIGLSTISIMWDPNIFGKVLYNKVINTIKDDDRPCLFIILKNKNDIYILINVHMPWGKHHNTAINNINKYIAKDNILQKYLFHNKSKIIMMGDFNDEKTLISKNKPFIITNKKNTVRLNYNKTKKNARKTLKSCCWHKLKHKYKYYNSTGDYILVNKNIKQIYIKIPNIFKKKGRLNRLLSDHMPVISRIKII